MMRIHACLGLIAVAMLATTPACAQSSQAAPPVTASHAWIRVMPGALPAGAYVTLENTGNTAIVLISASSPNYRAVMLHRSTFSNGMSHMHPVKQLTLPAHGTVTFAPGGYHLMLMHATHPVKPGDTVPITLHFADGRALLVQFAARPANAH